MQYLAARPLPTAPDGRYDAEVVPVTAATTDNDPHSDLYRATKNMITNLKNVAPIMQEALDPTVHMTVVPDRQSPCSFYSRSTLFADLPGCS